MRHAAKLPGMRVAGVDMHIGSQITELSPFADAFALLVGIRARALRADGHTISHVDLGGGLGIPYRDGGELPPDPTAYAEIVKNATRGLGCKLIFEPGRLIVGNAGILVTRVLYVKRGEAKTFVIVDAAMNDLIRPTLYEAHHEFWPVRETDAGARRSSPTWSDPVCETGDYLALDRDHAGAEGRRPAGGHDGRAPMARCRPAPTTPARSSPKCMVKGDEWSVVRPRLEADALIGLDRLPPWL